VNPKVIRGILKKVKSKRGCSIRDFGNLIPRSAHWGDTPVPEYSYNIDDLQQLIKWGFVEAYKGERLVQADKINNSNVSSLSFYLSTFAVKLEDALGVDLTSTPIFGEPKHSVAWPAVFVLMPFIPELRTVFDDHIKKAAKELGLSAARADDFFSIGSIMQDVWSAINYARVVIADCTQRNPNVFYEIGIAHTLGKETILISQDLKDIPFDLRHLRFIIYDPTPRGMTEFEEGLKSTLRPFSRKVRSRK